MCFLSTACTDATRTPSFYCLALRVSGLKFEVQGSRFHNVECFPMVNVEQCSRLLNSDEWC